MEQAEGSLRSSHREINPVRLKVAPKPLQIAARQLVSSVCETGPIIRQRLDIERMKQPLQKGVFYAAENEGKSEPGFLVFLPGRQAVVYLQMKQHSAPPAMLRMRVSPVVSDSGGSVFVATLDPIMHTLRIEDVWMWRGARLFMTTPFSKRRETLKEFVEQHWIPDARLMGGIATTILNPISLDELCKKSLVGTNTIDLIPDSPGRRRMWMHVAEAPAAARAQAPAAARAQAPAAAPAKPPAPALNSVTPLRAKAVPVDKMPDIYDVYDENGTLISRASVQIFALSQELRSKCGPEGVWVYISWRKEFNGYEIIKFA
jgi:hypothetical protein